MKPSILILFILILSASCKSSQTSLEDYTGEKIILANGGGFTGQVIEYILLETGDVFRTNSLDKSVIHVTELSSSVTKQIFNNYNILQIADTDLNEPGNMYFYIRWQDGSNQHEVKWNTDSKGINVDKVKLFYQTVLNRIKK